MVSYISNEPQKQTTVMWCQVTHNQKPARISKQEHGIRKQEDKKYKERKMM